MSGISSSISLPYSKTSDPAAGVGRKLLARFSPWCPWLVIGVGAILLTPIYFNRAYSFDEIWFYDLGTKASEKLTEDGFFSFVATQENTLGYGALYWIIYAHLDHFFSEPRVAARILAFFCMLSAPICAVIYAKRTKTQFGWFAVLLWFTFPLCWWTGKISGPETYSMMLSTVGIMLLLLHRGSPRLLFGATLLGVAIGLKLTMAPLAVFGGFVVWRRSQSRLKMLALLGCGMLLGFIVANPIVVFNWEGFIKNLTQIASISSDCDIPRPSLGYVHYLFTNSIWEWDGVFRGGFFDWGLAGVTFVLWSIFLWRAGADREILFGFAALMLCATVLFITKSRFYGWYWFPIIALIPLVTCEACVHANRRLIALATAILIINAIYARPLIQRGWEIKRDQIAAIENRKELQRDVQKVIAKTKLRIGKLVWCVEQGVAPSVADSSTKLGRKSTSTLTSWDAFRWFHTGKYTKLEPGQATCIVFSRNMPRIDRNRNIVDLRKQLPDANVRVTPTDYADIFIIHRQDFAGYEKLSQNSGLNRDGK